VMSVRASAFGANHRRSASPSSPLETSSTTQRHDLPFATEFKARPRVVALLLRHPTMSMPTRSAIYVIDGILWVL
jgi:hypothetical protein